MIGGKKSSGKQEGLQQHYIQKPGHCREVKGVGGDTSFRVITTSWYCCCCCCRRRRRRLLFLCWLGGCYLWVLQLPCTITRTEDINHVSFTSPHRSFLIQIHTRILKHNNRKRKHKSRLQLTGRSGHGNDLLRKKIEVDREEDVAKCKQADERQRRGEQTMEEEEEEEEEELAALSSLFCNAPPSSSSPLFLRRIIRRFLYPPCSDLCFYTKVFYVWIARQSN